METPVVIAAKFNGKTAFARQNVSRFGGKIDYDMIAAPEGALFAHHFASQEAAAAEINKIKKVHKDYTDWTVVVCPTQLA